MKNFVMYSDDLLSKWGFGDGDRLSDYISDNMPTYNEYTAKVPPHKALEELVKRYLLPKLEKKVEIFYVESIHNPVRAEMIDGVYYLNHYAHDDDGLLGDVTVEVTLEQILEIMEMKEMTV